MEEDKIHISLLEASGYKPRGENIMYRVSHFEEFRFEKVSPEHYKFLGRFHAEEDIDGKIRDRKGLENE